MVRFLAATVAAAVAVALALAGCTAPGGPDASRSEVVVHMKNVAYDPVILEVAPGTTVTWINDDAFGHTVTPTDKASWGTQGSGDAQSDWLMEGDRWSFTFEEEGEFEYYCIPHASETDGQWRGMVAKVVVKEGASGQVGAAGPEPAWPVDVLEIGADAMDVPPPVQRSQAAHVWYNLTSQEVAAEMADGTTFAYWSFDHQVPGPMLRVRQGDTVTVSLHNEASSATGHNIDFHAATGPGGGAAVLDAAPGETATLTFKALHPGLFVYHCAYQDPPLHVAHGMYGLILVEPAEGLAPVDREFYVVQGDFYSAFTADQEGHHPHSNDRAMAEDPTFVVFNGRMGSLQDGDRQLQAQVGDRVRMYVGNGGPNLVSSFHVIGEVFDRVWDQGGMGAAPQENIQTTLVPAGGASIVEFDLEVPGDYYLVDHSIYRVHKGAFGILHVEGEEAPETFRPGS